MKIPFCPIQVQGILKGYRLNHKQAQIQRLLSPLHIYEIFPILKSEQILKGTLNPNDRDIAVYIAQNIDSMVCLRNRRTLMVT